MFEIEPSFDAIPTLDLSLADDPSTKPQLLAKLRHTLFNVGFLYVENHGVPKDTINELVNSLPELFRITDQEKEEIELDKSPHFLGYSGLGKERTAMVEDQREQFEFATELEEQWVEGEPLYRRLLGPNQWPSSLPHIRPIIETYIESLFELSTRFLDLVAEALDLPPSALQSFLSQQHRIKIAHYSPATSSNTQGVGPHKDSSGWWTFLLQASPAHIRGLQAMNRNGEWIDIPNIPDTFVVNIGQAFEVATNGLCPATTHRVLSSEHDRYSIPFFQGVRGDARKKDFEALWPLLQDKNGVVESKEGKQIDSPFLTGNYDTWGESQLRTKIRSHRDAGQKFYADVFDKYINE